MQLGMRSRQAIFPPSNNVWALHQTDGYLQVPYPVRFATRESFENFVAEIVEIHGDVNILVANDTRESAGLPAWSAPLKSAAEAFAFTSQKVYRLQVTAGPGRFEINNESPLTQIAIEGVERNEASALAGEWIALVAKHVRASPKWRKRPRVLALTDVPGAESRVQKWQAWVAAGTVFLGGVAGAVGAWIVSPH